MDIENLQQIVAIIRNQSPNEQKQLMEIKGENQEMKVRLLATALSINELMSKNQLDFASALEIYLKKERS